MEIGLGLPLAFESLCYSPWTRAVAALGAGGNRRGVRSFFRGGLVPLQAVAMEGYETGMVAREGTKSVLYGPFRGPW